VPTRRGGEECAAVWRGTARRGAARRGAVRRGAARCGAAWRGAVWGSAETSGKVPVRGRGVGDRGPSKLADGARRAPRGGQMHGRRAKTAETTTLTPFVCCS